MGEIVIKVPQSIHRRVEVADEALAAKLIELIQDVAASESGNNSEDEVTGIWRDRFKDETPAEVGRRLRREMWQRS